MRRSVRHRSAGFTLIELLVVLALFTVVLLISAPGLINYVARSKTLGAATQMSTLFRLARAQAVKRGVPVVVKVLAVDTSEGKRGDVFAFTDVDNDGVWDEPASTDSAYDLDGNKLQGSFHFPSGLVLSGPGVADDGNATAFDGFQTVSGGKVGIVRFLPSGAVDRIGAVRIRDYRDNILEVRVEPQASGRVSLRKYEGDPFAGSDDLTLYYVQGAKPWNWRS